MFHQHKKCRACGNSELVKVLDLGVQPLANNFISEGGECAGYAPLAVLFCRNCTLAQLSATVKPEVLYKDYCYVTGESETLKRHINKLLTDIGIGRKPKPKMLEIGSNNGVFLGIAAAQFEVLGIEPARNLAKIANDRGVKTIDRMFDTPSAIELGSTGYRADVIVARHVFAHVDDWKGFIHALQFITHKDTLVVIEVPYVWDMLEMNSFDQIYHEHLSYVSIRAIHELLEGTLFELSDVKHYEIHGGAIALFLRRRGTGARLNPEYHSKFEEKDLEQQWGQLNTQYRRMIYDLKIECSMVGRKGHTVCGFGASAKATVWINACGFTSKDIAFVVDNTPQKQGKFIPGTEIPIVGEERLLESDYCINFAWNFHKEIAEKHKAFTDRGGKWILPVPDVKIL